MLEESKLRLCLRLLCRLRKQCGGPVLASGRVPVDIREGFDLDDKEDGAEFVLRVGVDENEVGIDVSHHLLLWAIHAEQERPLGAARQRRARTRERETPRSEDVAPGSIQMGLPRATMRVFSVLEHVFEFFEEPLLGEDDDMRSLPWVREDVSHSIVKR